MPDAVTDSTFSLELIINFIIWLTPRAGKMKGILCSDWLPERGSRVHLARSELPALVPRTKDFLEPVYVVH